MRKALSLFFIFYIMIISAQGKRFFETGQVELKKPVEKINLRYANELAFVQVNINDKFYNFLLDSGAPTVISTTLYKELKLSKKYKTKVKDSQKSVQQQIFTQLPEMRVDQVVFRNIGAMVMDLTISELGCFKIDGILGANQMAKVFWKINYSENSIQITKDLSNFDLTSYNTVIPFDAQPQKTPVVESNIAGKKINLTFDTGFSGSLKIQDKLYSPEMKSGNSIETYGTNSVGAFGGAKPTEGYIFTVNKITLGNKSFPNEIITTGNSSLIGNGFFKDFSFIMDWKNNKVYLQQIKSSPPSLESFGFGYRFIDEKPVIVYVFKDEKLPLKIGDSILSINDVSFENLNKESACYYYINRVESASNTIKIKVDRDGETLAFILNKKEYIKVL
ncbi:aspartyl protease family protein [Chryseobacterium sp.]|mgnify:CR=1 FL=1|uniref:aspartyl protease family protein n=1 Tax=Chryseobacterium sp. TaxID=1871047 RepID=UPI0025C71B4B|nr:aspartyl protease family protein [Chryseobacterium sp.]